MRKMCDNLKRLSAFSLCFIFLLVSSGCTNEPVKVDNSEQAETFIATVLTMPNEHISEVAMITPTENNLADYNNKMREAVISMCNDYATQDVIEGIDGGATFYQEIVTFQFYAAWYDYTILVNDIKLTETAENQYRYEVTATASYSEDPITLSGSIRFNEEGLVEYMSLNYPYYDPDPEHQL